MIVCQCNIISDRDIEDVITSLLDDDSWRLIVPLQVYHEMGKRGRCCGCFPNVVDIIVRTTEAYHLRLASPQAEIISFIEKLKEAHLNIEHARRRASERLSEIRAALSTRFEVGTMRESL